MSSRDKTSPVLLPLRVILVLVICICSLAVHFIAEGLSPVDGQTVFELTAQGGHAHPVHEHSEDYFVFSSLGRLHVEHLPTWPVSQAPARSLSVLISPLLPPPNS
jgi:hypothetical protein